MANNAQSFKAPQCEKQATELAAQKLVCRESRTDAAPCKTRRGRRAAGKSRPDPEAFALAVMLLSLDEIRRRDGRAPYAHWSRREERLEDELTLQSGTPARLDADAWRFCPSGLH